ncbi:cation:proton antiporter [Deinococcus cellulosilyticus]|uniref:Sodium:proton antiporter n=1 Tax=Deinococcus cellulosilyticus (strain DSM 18568 / NBRC 106333 / KACC 11606 / 5516J-15) TaxID=1223518 RepID=A0A511N2U3_DEIC1|nr:cation:proton antiporter [Deinococcus cellulosilyticus]GEM46827.1 sodium:proton antiporter [Deinococcus cellulosilyticus NBRC 106333 = KACC 11606]
MKIFRSSIRSVHSPPRMLPLLALMGGGSALAAGNAEVTGLLLQLFYLVLAAQVGSWLFAKLGLPRVVGQVAAGVVVGPSLLSVVGESVTMEALAEIGAIFLMFMVGLETRFKDLLQVGKEALMVALLGIILPMVGGYFFGVQQGHGNIESLFIATTLVATSVGITAKVLQEMGVLDRKFAQIILGAAVIDDILGLTILAVVSGLGKGGEISMLGVLTTLGISVGFVVAVLLIGIPLLRRFQSKLNNLPLANSFGMAVVVGLGLAALSSLAGLAPIIGAFLAGMVLAEVKDEHTFESKVHALEDFLAPVFFAMVGVKLDLAALGSPSVLTAGGILTVIAVITKLVGGFTGALSQGRKQALLVGLGMVPRGEVGLIVAGIGLSYGVIQKDVFAQVIVMVLLTTVLAPIALRILLGKDTPAPA